LIKKIDKGRCVVISSPSGAGKTTISKLLVGKLKNSNLSISLTTRLPRKKERNKIDYFFVTKNYFKKKINSNSFLEYANVFGNFYGTLKKNIHSDLRKKKTIILDIDWQGARQIKKNLSNNTTTIFILPPSLIELKKRLMNRESDLEFIKKRMSKAKKEIMHWKEYDYVVVNKNLNECVATIQKILSLETLKPSNFKLK
jgi:guanylate kinase